MITERPISNIGNEEVLADRTRRPVSAGRVVTHAILIAMSILMIFPLFWLVSTSLKHPQQTHAVAAATPSKPGLLQELQ